MGTSERHRVSVVIPCFNVERYLDQCLASVEAQPYGDVEIVCVNDGSTDSSLAIMREHASRDPRIRVIDKPNQGYGASCNRGIGEATGDYLAIVEPDDWVEGDMYGEMLSFADSLGAGPIDVIESDYVRVIEPDTPRERRFNCSYRGRVRPASQPFAIGEGAELLGHHPSIWTALYRLAWLRERSIRFREYPGAGWADNPWLVETLCQTDRIAYLGRAYYHYREDVTVEGSLQFVRSDVLMPLARWNDMQDVVERLGVTDERVLAMQCKRASMYAAAAIDAAGIDHPGMRDAVAGAFARCDADVFLSNPIISPASKRLFCELTGRPDPGVSDVRYAGELVRQGVYALRNNGFSFARDMAASVVARHGRRGGHPAE